MGGHNREHRSLPLITPASRFFRIEVRWWASGALLAYLIAGVVLCGWPIRLVPRLDAPFIYGGDGLSHAWMIQRVIEGWLFDNPRSGYPFGSAFFDYPGSDTGNFVVIKVLGWLTGTWYGAANLYFVLGFPVTFVVTYVVARSLGLWRAYAFVMALLFTLAPYHFSRFTYGHIFYTWYFVVPIYLYYAVRLAVSDHSLMRAPWTRWALRISVMVVAAGFGVYFAFFATIALIAAALAASLQRQTWRPWMAALLLGFGIGGGVALNVLPNMLYHHSHGPNPEVAARNPVESEIFGLKIMHLLLPQPNHPVARFASFAQSYSRDFPLSNTSSSLGIVGVAGLGLMLLNLLSSAVGRRLPAIAGAVAAITLLMLLTGTVGGFSSMFALLVSPLIRGWDRSSIYIAFTALLTFFLALQQGGAVGRRLPVHRRGVGVLATAVALFGVWDQTPSSFKAITVSARADFAIDHKFVGSIEAAVPEGAAIYQLPYMTFPEAAQKEQLSGYVPLGGVLNSKTLKWSFGGMQGREGDLYFRLLSEKPIVHQVEALRAHGFQGIYLDLRGYADHGKTIIAGLSEVLGKSPDLVRGDGQVVFYSLAPSRSLGERRDH